MNSYPQTSSPTGLGDYGAPGQPGNEENAEDYVEELVEGFELAEIE